MHAAPNSQIVGDMEHLWKNNIITGKLGPGIANQIGKVKPVVNGATEFAAQAHSKIHSLARRAGDAAASGLVQLADPATAAMNYGKRLLAANEISHIGPVKRTQDFLNKHLVTDRIGALNDMGVAGKKIPFRGTKKFLDEYVANPLISGAKIFAYDAGAIAHKHGLTPEIGGAIKGFFASRMPKTMAPPITKITP